ncbi:hypothetical protein AVEN_105241-1 [Araneus ventricosus]|uniref:Uncharacterized protein n=1 Tax=Araneus ventricosus TaxID=182803 RepID=A0A4Y2KFE3_ARAVE|nr:hypothetical protein AVEN_105241-1 [Araneus ventricosus]
MWSATNAYSCSEKDLEVSKRKLGYHHPLGGADGQIIGVISVTWLPFHDQSGACGKGERRDRVIGWSRGDYGASDVERRELMWKKVYVLLAGMCNCECRANSFSGDAA